MRVLRQPGRNVGPRPCPRSRHTVFRIRAHPRELGAFLQVVQLSEGQQALEGVAGILGGGGPQNLGHCTVRRDIWRPHHVGGRDPEARTGAISAPGQNEGRDSGADAGSRRCSGGDPRKGGWFASAEMSMTAPAHRTFVAANGSGRGQLNLFLGQEGPPSNSRNARIIMGPSPVGT